MKCIRCGSSMAIDKICSSCLTEYSEMKTEVWNKLIEKYGKLTTSNLPIFQKETKRLVRIWRKDKNEFKIKLQEL